jgi:hypothetical protein
MRGIEDIKTSNENPHHRTDEQFGTSTHEGDPTAYRSFETNLRDKRRRDRLAQDVTAQLLVDIGVPAPGSKAHAALDPASKAADLFFAALLLDIVAQATEQAKASGKPTPEPEHQERVHSAIDGEPPFIQFWFKLNEGLAEQGLPEATYGVARKAFGGGDTPIGSLTFIGKQWDGLRAVPATPVEYLGGKRPAYHGEYRTVGADEGVVWRKVLNKHDEPIAYQIPEAAITAAEHARKEYQS